MLIRLSSIGSVVSPQDNMLVKQLFNSLLCDRLDDFQ
jgi:hypothetical protein